MKLLFLAGRYYLSNDLYAAIAKRFVGDEIIYLDDSRTNPESRNGVQALSQVKPPFECRHVDFSIPVRPIGEGRFSTKVYLWKRALREYDAMLDRLDPDVAITYTDMSMSGRMVGMWAQRRRRPFFVLQAAFVDNPLMRDAIQPEQKLRYFIFNRILGIPKYRRQHFWGGELRKAHVLLWGDSFRLPYRHRARVEVVGNPAYDGLYGDSAASPGDAVLLCAQPSPASTGIAAAIAEVARLRPDLRFIVKTHPRVREAVWEERLAGIPNVRIAQDGKADSYLRLAKMQVSIGSVTTLESILYGIPVICLTHKDPKLNLITGKADQFHRFFEGIAENAIYDDPADILRCIAKMESGSIYNEFLERRSAFIADKLLSLDGQASERVEKMIRSSIAKEGRVHE